MKELSSFIDKSGDFGEVKERLAYYLVTFFIFKAIFLIYSYEIN